MKEWDSQDTVSRALNHSVYNAALMPEHPSQMRLVGYKSHDKCFYERYSEFLRLAPDHIKVLMLQKKPSLVLKTISPSDPQYYLLCMLALRISCENINLIDKPDRSMVMYLLAQGRIDLFCKTVKAHGMKDAVKSVISQSSEHVVKLFVAGLVDEDDLMKGLRRRPSFLREVVNRGLGKYKYYEAAVDVKPSVASMLTVVASVEDWIKLVRLHPSVINEVPTTKLTREVALSAIARYPKVILTDTGVASALTIGDIVDLLTRQPNLSEHPELCTSLSHEAMMACARALPHRCLTFKCFDESADLISLIKLNAFYGLQACNTAMLLNVPEVVIAIKQSVLNLDVASKESWVLMARALPSTGHVWSSLVDEIDNPKKGSVVIGKRQKRDESVDLRRSVRIRNSV
jgi:hypothetical protein